MGRKHGASSSRRMGWWLCALAPVCIMAAPAAGQACDQEIAQLRAPGRTGYQPREGGYCEGEYKLLISRRMSRDLFPVSYTLSRGEIRPAKGTVVEVLWPAQKAVVRLRGTHDRTRYRLDAAQAPGSAAGGAAGGAAAAAGADSLVWPTDIAADLGLDGASIRLLAMRDGQAGSALVYLPLVVRERPKTGGGTVQTKPKREEGAGIEGTGGSPAEGAEGRGREDGDRGGSGDAEGEGGGGGGGGAPVVQMELALACNYDASNVGFSIRRVADGAIVRAHAPPRERDRQRRLVRLEIELPADGGEYEVRVTYRVKAPGALPDEEESATYRVMAPPAGFAGAFAP